MSTQYNVRTGKRQHVLNTRSAIVNRTPFSTSGALSGETGNRGGWGRLIGSVLDDFTSTWDQHDYTVFSYATPIAWHTPEGWTVNMVKYSVTTDTHRSAVIAALAGAGIQYREVY